MGYWKRVEEERAWRSKQSRRKSQNRQIQRWDVVYLSGYLRTCEELTDLAIFQELFYMSTFEDVFAGARPKKGEPSAIDMEFAAAFPVLNMMLCVTESKPGAPRQTCTLILVCEEGVWKLGLRERDMDLSLWVSGGTHHQALQALEDALNERPVPWRTPPKTRGGRHG